MFSLLATIGAFWIGKAHRSLAAGIWAAAATLTFMALLMVMVVWAISPLLSS